jgi:ABC-type microcin C transport system permease subunit YejB
LADDVARAPGPKPASAAADAAVGLASDGTCKQTINAVPLPLLPERSDWNPILARRLAQIIPTLFFVSMLIFGLQQLLPGDPALILAGEEQDPKVIEEIRKQLPARRAAADAVRLLGRRRAAPAISASRCASSSRVAELVAEKLPVTLQLAAWRCSSRC